MNQINNSYASHGQPFSAAALSFMQASYIDAIAGLAEALIGNIYAPGVVYVLQGCTFTTSGSNITFAPGYFFHNGEIYYFAGVGPIAGTIITCVANMATTVFDDSTGTAFADGFNTPIRQIRQVTVAVGASGSGTLSGTDASNAYEWYYMPSITGLSSLISSLQGSVSTINGQIATLNNEISLGTWNTVTMGTNWVNTGSARQIRVDGTGRAYLNLAVTADAGAASHIATLPSGSYPLDNWQVTAESYISGTYATTGITISNAGVITFTNSSFSASPGNTFYISGSWLIS